MFLRFVCGLKKSLQSCPGFLRICKRKLFATQKRSDFDSLVKMSQVFESQRFMRFYRVLGLSGVRFLPFYFLK